MLEWFLVLVAGVIVISKLQSRRLQQVKARWGLGKAPATKPAVAPPPVVPKPRLTIAGTQRPRIADLKFLRSFGVNPRALADLRIYAQFGCLAQFPDALRKLLEELHGSGCAVGSKMMELMHHSRPLNQGEAIYFALVERGREAEIVAFVDRVRLK